jgi:lipid-A-disaccharide synthase
MKLFLFAGEHSGDLHGSHLLSRLKELSPTASFVGVGGPKMRSVGLETVMQMENFAVMGFSDVIKKLPQIIRQFRFVSRSIFEHKPDGVILIDYPDFNLRLANHLRKNGYHGKIIYYISPSVWAWRSGRIASMAKNLDLLLTIYPFESKYYQGSSLPVTYVGNPLREYLKSYSYESNWKTHYQIPEDVPILALFPGSRPGEIERNLPLQLQATKRLLQESGEARSVAISCGAAEHAADILKLAGSCGWPAGIKLYFVPQRHTYELMRDSHAALAKSGTVTLELALHNVPTVAIYKMTTFNYVVAKYVMRLNLPHYCIVNILMQKEAFPECIEYGVTVQNIYEQLKKMDSQGEHRTACLEDCQSLAQVLHGENASSSAAQAILARLME